MKPRERMRRLGLNLLCVGVAATAAPAQAGDWKLTNNLQVTSYLSDNIRHTADGDAGMGVTVRPRIRLQGKGGRVNGVLSYAPSLNAVFGSDAPNPRVSHDLYADFNSELVRQTLFLDATARAGLITGGTFAGAGYGDLATSNETSQTYSFSLSPYTRHHLGSNADLEFRLGFNAVRTDYGASTLDSTGQSASVRLTSGRGFTRLPWSVTALRHQTDYSGRTDTRDALSGTLGYRFNRTWRIDGSLGYDRYDVYSGRSSTSGVSYSGGLQWTPNPRTSAKMELGERYYGTFWRAHGEHQSRRTLLTLDLSREVTNVNSLLTRRLSNLDAYLIGRFQDITSINPNDPSNVTEVGLLNEDYLNTRVAFGARVTGRRTTVSALADWNERQYEVTPRQDRIMGLTLRGNRRLGGRINVNASVRWQDVQSTSSGDSQYWYLQIGGSRAVGRYTRLGVDISRQQRTSDGTANEFTEHRIGVTLTTRMF